MAVKDLSNERRPQVTVPQDQVTEPQVTVPQDAESQFYISENLPPPGKHFDDPKETVDTYTAKTAPNLEKDAKKLPNVAENINIILANKFADRNHYVRIDYVGCKLFYFLKWKNGKAAQKPVKLFEFDELNLPVETKEFLAFKIKQKAVTLEDNGKIRKIVLKDTDDKTMGPVRYLIIPVNPHESYTNDNGVVNGDAYGYDLYILAGEKGVKERTTTQVNNGGADKTTLYTLDIWPAGDTIKPKPSTDKIAIEKTPKSKLDPTTPQEFAERVVNRVTRDGVPEIAEIVFTIDTSWSTAHAVGLVINHIADIMKGLKDKGVKKIKVGVTTINIADVKILLPLTKMDDEGLLDLFERLGTIQNVVGEVNLGEAVDKSIGMLRDGDKGAAKSIFVMTDYAALGEDWSLAPYVSDGVAKGEENNIAVDIKMEYDSQSSIPIKVAAEIQKYLLTGDKNQLFSLAKYDPNLDVRLSAAEALVEIGEIEAAKEAFIKLAKYYPDWNVRLYAAKALVEMGEVEAVKEVFLHVANNDPNWYFRQNAAETLVKMDEIEAAKEAFLYIAKNAPKESVHSDAINALMKMGETEAAKEISNKYYISSKKTLYYFTENDNLSSVPIRFSWPVHCQLNAYILSSNGWSDYAGITALLSIPLNFLANLSFFPSYSQLKSGYRFFGNIGYSGFGSGSIDSPTQYDSHSFEIGPELRFVPFGETPIILSTSLLLGKGTNSKKLSKGNVKPTSSGFTYGAKASLAFYGLGIGAKYDSYLDKFFYSFDIDVATMLGLFIGGLDG